MLNNESNGMQTISQLINLDGRKSIVIGGAGHIGSVVVDTLLELGSEITILDKNITNTEQARLKHDNPSIRNIHIVNCDLLYETETRNAIRESIHAMQGVDIIVHCAGYVGTTDIPGWAVPFKDQSLEAFNQAIQVNLSSAFIVAQESSEALSLSGHGSLILFSSIYGSQGPNWKLYEGTNMANPIGYGASKGGLVQTMRYLATTLAPHVRVNTISPGGILRDQPQIFQDRYIRNTPLARLAKEDDIKGAVAFLASDMSKYVTGIDLFVDGGWATW